MRLTAIAAGSALALAAAPPAWALQRCVATDGDSLVCAGERVRLFEPQAPERGERARCPREAELAEDAAARLAELVAGGVTVEPRGRDRWGRLLASVRGADRLNVGERMIFERHAVRFAKGQRVPWCSPAWPGPGGAR